jgi:hypothetical protein
MSTVICSVLCAAALVFPSAAAAETSFPATAGDLAAGRGELVWSPGPLASPGPLMAAFGPTAAPLPVASARFGGIDIGTDARGRTVLVYSACNVRSSPCLDLYLYSFASRSSRRLGSLSTPNCAESSPQIWHGAILFVRGRCKTSGLYLKRPGKPVRRLSALPRPVLDPQQHLALDSFDLAGRRLAFVERRVSDELPVGSTFRVVTEVRTLRLGQSHSRLLARARKLESPTSTGASVGQAHLDGGFVYWTRADFNTCGPDLPGRQDILRRPIDGNEPAAVLERTGRLYAQPDCDTLGTYAVSGNELYYSFNDPRLRPPNTSSWPTNAIARVDGPLTFR